MTERKSQRRMVQVQARISRARYDRLLEILATSCHGSLSEVLRTILEDKPLVMKRKSLVLDQLMEQLILIHGEIHRIGVNVNQVARQFHQSKQPIGKFLLGKKLTASQDALELQIQKLNLAVESLQKRLLSE